ncbi:MAG: phosphoribosylformylglycinamidine synthase subunit PurL [SAR202 cluster bacterium]|jgi:phosphoribosylformylglycinamidine synthase|nr:phosphoribosylformylglycinamidine synthase II [Planctomycetaceae bacterium]MDP7586332.1 phosphoribosylformylglycinamidine synthase subunit PurL [Dehalococcoidia bacterium]MQF87528.1 phosphoribosylformylglycinamidine synthase subunit PurL [SAR202 cluster bacterium]|tara:strand:- start:12782 stop:15004 length:2223 start_codon:yes stop_codon:yes gene_type:complete
MAVTKETLDEIALSRAEYDLILERLDREPNPVELGMFGALWSEHCGYKHSRPLLRRFNQNPAGQRPSRVLSQTGAENAGAVDIGDGLAVVFKVESHNHPSAVEPLQGAATGVGGIVRDILAMGARPIALLNSLRFGPLDDPQNKYLFHGVVDGISWYGNCIGVPDVAGEICFDESYSQNPLVNAMCVGLVRTDTIATSAASEVDNVMLLVGAGTGRDGIHGASGLASRTFEEEVELRPTVQVGNPFLEKVLIEACLEALDTGLVNAIQDLGAAGLTSAAIESAASGGRGIRLDISQVHQREEGMSPYEVMLSESQERMLLVVAPENVPAIKAVMEKWDVTCREIGVILAEQTAQVAVGSELVVDLPIGPLSEAPQYSLEGKPSEEDIRRRQLNLDLVPLPQDGPQETLIRLLASPNIANKEGVYRQYDHQVQTNTVVGPGSDAAVLRIKGTDKAIAVTIDGNGRLCQLDPYQGGQIVVAEVCRNLSCSGALPLAITDCLNFGSPERPDVYNQLEQAIQGIADACRVLEVPVVSGNVSLYNESRGQAIFPTPVVGGLGLLEVATNATRSAFAGEGLMVVLLGADPSLVDVDDLAGSEYLQRIHGRVEGRPKIDIDLEKRVQALCREGIGQGLITSAHDCSEGGLAVALAECSIQGGIGFNGDFAIDDRWDAVLFGERQSRIVVSLPGDLMTAFVPLASSFGVPVSILGYTGGDRFQLKEQVDVPVSQITEVWNKGLEVASG